MNKLMMCTSSSANAEFGASIDPASVNVNTDNGLYRSPNYNVSASNGSGDYEYEWSAESNNGSPVVINVSDTEIYIEVSGYNDLVEVNISCKVTDNVTTFETTAGATLIVFFGDLLL